jgi:hypothetical protein
VQHLFCFSLFISHIAIIPCKLPFALEFVHCILFIAIITFVVVRFLEFLDSITLFTCNIFIIIWLYFYVAHVITMVCFSNFRIFSTVSCFFFVQSRPLHSIPRAMTMPLITNNIMVSNRLLPLLLHNRRPRALTHHPHLQRLQWLMLPQLRLMPPLSLPLTSLLKQRLSPPLLRWLPRSTRRRSHQPKLRSLLSHHQSRHKA